MRPFKLSCKRSSTLHLIANEICCSQPFAWKNRGRRPLSKESFFNRRSRSRYGSQSYGLGILCYNGSNTNLVTVVNTGLVVIVIVIVIVMRAWRGSFWFDRIVISNVRHHATAGT